MEAPSPLLAGPLHPIPTTTPVLSPESLDSSPRSRLADVDPPPQKLRLMCSYGGHIVPRPHDKTLCYVGGDTRIIVVDRHTSLSDIRRRLSKTLLHDQSFFLKYQLPNEDLDSLISVTTDEDLENMVEEYDRLNNAGGGSRPGRLRIFLFPNTPSNIEELLVETASTKSDDWFFNALNGKVSALSNIDRGFSDSSSVNHLLGLDDDLVGQTAKEAQVQIEGSQIGGRGNGSSNSVINLDVQSVPDSPMLETTSSFGSTSSSLSAPNLPPIKVRVEENSMVGGLGIDNQFQPPNVGVTLPSKQDEAVDFDAAGVMVGRVVSGVPMMVMGSEYANRLISDDERSDHGGYKKAQQIQQQGLVQLQPHQNQIPHIQLRQTGAFDLHSPDSVSSDGSYTNPLSKHRQTAHQEPVTQMQSVNTKATANQADPRTGDQNNTKVQMQPQVQESGYVLSGQYDQSHPHLHQHQQQQLVHHANQYIPAGAVPVASYYPIYPSQPAFNHQRPVYFVAARPTQAYNIPGQQLSYNEPAHAVPPSHPQTPQAPLAAYNLTVNVPSSKPEMAYRTAAGAAPQLAQQPQYVGYTQIQFPSQPMTTHSSAANSGHEFAGPSHAQMYYAQHMLPQLAAQYQMVASTRAVVPSDPAYQLPTENIKQQIRTLQQ